eukprot:gene25297-10951_t
MGGGVFIGRVVSNRMQKTVVVTVSYCVWVPKYKVYERRMSRHMAHDDTQQCTVGDIVRIKVTRKLSKMKSYAVQEVLRQAPVFDVREVDALIASRDGPGGRPSSWTAMAEERLNEAGLRLQAVKDMLAKEVGTGTSLSGSVFEEQQGAKGSEVAQAARKPRPNVRGPSQPTV